MIGKTLAHYEITSELGKGGMGEVYRARDSKLERDVAIKVLPAAFTEDRERLARFEREAKLLASLNHPNIAHVYGFERATREDGSTAVHFLAMELVEGEDLSERLKRGPIPFDEALAIATQIAEALEEAHEKGIVHRDLKPANAKLTPDGKVKVLDFGLAKAYAAEASSSASADLSQSPTLAQTKTLAGVILGTAAYMSPEQARGKPVDKRADIWAFGVVLYEMLTGRRLFTGETVSDVLAAVLTREPDWNALASAAPPSVRELLRRCLVREPRERLRDIGEARLALSTVSSAAAPSSVRAPAGPSWRVPAALVVGVVLAFAVLSVLRGGRSGRTDAATLRVVIEAPEWGSVGYSSGLYLGPDGQILGYHDRDTHALRLRAIDSWESRVVARTAGSRDGFLSPDGRWFAYKNQDKGTLEKVLVEGGTPVVLASDVSVYNSGVWGTSGDLYVSASIGPRAGLWRMREDGSALTLLKDREVSGMGWFLDLLPGENALVYTGTSPGEAKDADLSDMDRYDERIEALVLADNSVRLSLEGGRQARTWNPATSSWS